MQLLKQEQNAAQLKIYVSVMHLYFHLNEDDFNVSMSLLSIWHQELHEHFLYYASCFEQYYHSDRKDKKENLIIVQQGVINFLSLMNLASSAEDVVALFDESL